MNSTVLSELLKENPIAITGMGVVSAAGASPKDLCASASGGVSNADWLACGGAFSPSGDQALKGNPLSQSRRYTGCAIPRLALDDEERRLTHKLDRSSQLAVIAARQAWADAAIGSKLLPSLKVGVIAGTSRGPVEKWSEAVRHEGQKHIPPSHAVSGAIASVSGAVSIALKAQGPCFTVSAACASSAAAIVLAAQQLLIGGADIMLAGGAEAPLHPSVMGSLASSGVLGSHDDPRLACRPFDLSRNGTVLGEGAAFLVLEPLLTAMRRGAHVHALLAGFSLAADAGSRTGFGESADGLKQAVRQALDIAQLAPQQIGYVNVHGTGTALNDRMESTALGDIFGKKMSDTLFSSTKPVTGHCLGATAAIEAVICISALRRQMAPPSANCAQQDPECRLNLLRGEARKIVSAAVLSTSSGFWGNHAALVFSLGW